MHASSKNELLQITLPIREVKGKKLSMLYDSGSIISFIKLKHLKDDTLIYEKKIALIGRSRHKVYTLGKMYATIKALVAPAPPPGVRTADTKTKQTRHCSQNKHKKENIEETNVTLTKGSERLIRKEYKI